MGRRARAIGPGSRITEREFETITGERVRVPGPEGMTHMQFRRYAGCPICNVHLRSIVQRHGEITAVGVREVVVFHSTREDLLAYQEQLPFAVVADPHKVLYREFGVESSARAVVDPRAWLAGLRGLAGKRRGLSADHHSGHLGLPADFLIASDGRVLSCKYGVHAYDQWSADEIIALADQHVGVSSRD